MILPWLILGLGFLSLIVLAAAPLGWSDEACADLSWCHCPFCRQWHNPRTGLHLTVPPVPAARQPIHAVCPECGVRLYSRTLFLRLEAVGAEITPTLNPN